VFELSEPDDIPHYTDSDDSEDSSYEGNEEETEADDSDLSQYEDPESSLEDDVSEPAIGSHKKAGTKRKRQQLQPANAVGTSDEVPSALSSASSAKKAKTSSTKHPRKAGPEIEEAMKLYQKWDHAGNRVPDASQDTLSAVLVGT
jgi:hypothetical protein